MPLSLQEEETDVKDSGDFSKFRLSEETVQKLEGRVIPSIILLSEIFRKESCELQRFNALKACLVDQHGSDYTCYVHQCVQ